MRVAFITQEYPPHTDGGAGTYAGELVPALARLGVDVTLFTVDGAHGEGPAVAPVSPHEGGALGFWRRLPRAFAERVRREGPFDVVHGNGIADLPLIAVPGGGARVVTAHHVTRALLQPGVRGALRRLRDLRGETGLVPLVEGRVMRRAHRVIADTEMTRRDVLALCGVPGERVDVVHCGVAPAPAVAPERVRALRAELCPHGEAMLLAVGRLEHRKGTDVLLRALAGLDPAGPQARLVLAGGGQVGEYEAMARGLGIAGRVSFLGRVEDEVRDALYAACDVFVTASRLEGFGFVPLEAMSHGKPIVATRTGVVRDGLISERCGAIAEVGDAGSLREAIAGVLADPDRARSTGKQNARRVATELSWERAARRTLGAYEAACIAAGERAACAGRLG